VNLPRHGAAAIGSYFRPRLVVPLLRRATPRFQHAEARLAPGKHPGCGAFARRGEHAEVHQQARVDLPGGPSADGPHVRELTGAFVNPDPESIQETGFVLLPDGRVVVSVYFSGVIGRLTPEEVMGLVRYLACTIRRRMPWLPAGEEPVGLPGLSSPRPAGTAVAIADRHPP
jgi:hypothetical protein